MPLFTKPNLSVAWADSGDIITPVDTDIQTGWRLNTKPPRQVLNWIDRRQDKFLQYVNQQGIPTWDNYTEYQANISYVKGSNGKIYYCKQTHTNQDPVSDVTETYWRTIFLDKNDNLAGLTNLSTARTNIDVYSKAETDVIANPTGAVTMWTTASIPTGWLLCDGSAVSRTTYADLFAVIGSIYGDGNGVTTFNLPDFRGVFPRGLDNGRGFDTGRALGSYQADDLKSHTHTAALVDETGAGTFAGGNPANVTNGTGTTDATGGTETRPKNIAVNFIIKT